MIEEGGVGAFDGAQVGNSDGPLLGKKEGRLIKNIKLVNKRYGILF